MLMSQVTGLPKCFDRCQKEHPFYDVCVPNRSLHWIKLSSVTHFYLSAVVIIASMRIAACREINDPATQAEGCSHKMDIMEKLN